MNVNNCTGGSSVVANRSVAVAPEPPCQCTVDHFLAPLKFKMKGLKKIRKKIGLGMCVCVRAFLFARVDTFLIIILHPLSIARFV